MMSEKVYALVTGGTSGMGLEYVRELASRGYSVIVAALPGRTDEKGEPVGPPSPEAICSDLAAEFPETDFVPVAIDLARTEASQELYDKVFAARPDAVVEVLINNAGIINIRHFREMTAAQLNRELLLHNYTPTMLCHLFLPAMEERHKGYVLNVSSLAAWLPEPFISTYSATKAYNRIFSRALRTEYYGTGVQVATVYFGAVDTPLFNLKPSLRKLARNLHVMITPQQAANKALNMLFAGRSGKMPGVVNHIGKWFCLALPRPVVSKLDHFATDKLAE